MQSMDPKLMLHRPCKHLRCKEMYYNPQALAADGHEAAAYWCEKTLEAFGPDGQPAEKQECCPERQCYKR